jgi:hypothetical protein
VKRRSANRSLRKTPKIPKTPKHINPTFELFGVLSSRMKGTFFRIEEE